MSGLLGPLLVVIFCLSQALRDVYFGNLFQGVDFFAVLLLSFAISTAIFGGLALARCRKDLAILYANPGPVLAMNLLTAIAWSCYFFGLTHLEPAIVNTIHSGMAPLTVAVLGLWGGRLVGARPIDRAELAGCAGILLVTAALWFVVLTGRSGDRGGDLATLALALAALLVSGGSITLSLLFAKRLNDRGVTSTSVTATRYFLLILVAAVIELASSRPSGIAGPAQLGLLAAAATGLVVLPLFILQVGIALSAPATAQIIRALGPVFIFALEQFDGRLHYSAPVLASILAYSALAIAINVAHGRRREPARA
ncbi:MAG TPA: hypothetical protein VJR47_02700 [Stellaceae bacterium]|nr:hypothetical protein [Stellaceae bacterium]